MVTESDAVISVRGLAKTYRSGLIRRKQVHALRGVSLDVPKGKIFGLLGPNGAGKTTLIKILLGIVKPSDGQASVLGLKAGSVASRRQIGYLPENHRIPRHHNGNTALEYFGSLSGMPMSEIKKRRPELLELVGLKGREQERVGGYSKGMQQRLGLAQAMLHSPEVIILDEPTDGVDPVGRKDIRVVLKRMAAEGTTIFLNSHLLQELELVCESVAILVQGQVRVTGPVQELKQRFTSNALQISVGADATSAKSAIENFERASVRPSRDRNGSTIEFAGSDQSDVDRLVDALRAQEISIVSMHRRELTLEETFLQVVEPNS